MRVNLQLLSIETHNLICFWSCDDPQPKAKLAAEYACTLITHEAGKSHKVLKLQKIATNAAASVLPRQCFIVRSVYSVSAYLSK